MARKSQQSHFMRLPAIFSAIVASSNDAIISKDLNGIIRSWNKAAERLYGYSAKEAIGQPITLIFPERRKKDFPRIMEKIKEGQTVKFFSTERQHESGRIVPVSVTIAPIKNTKGQIIGASSTARDISRQKRLERQLKSKNKELMQQNLTIQKANRLKSEFLANMSHELRTPLNGIIGFTELMHSGKVGEVSAQHQEFLSDILSSSRHLLHLINDILDLTKIESGKMQFYPEKIEIKKIINEVCDILRTLIAKKRIQLKLNIAPRLKQLFLDPAKLKQVIYNYLSNAIKFTADDGKVIIRVLPENDKKFRLEIEDTGIGISHKDLDRLFIEFQQLDSETTKRYAGTGLGLALTKRIVEAQGGEVGVQSTFGEGSIFYALLPYYFTKKEKR